MLLLLLIMMSVATLGAEEKLARTPPMGWNSWDSYGQTLDEQHLRQIADKMAKELKPFGWQYVVIDEGWYIENLGADPKDYRFTISEDGRFTPSLHRFPSAADGAGFKPIADYIHSLGLKFGLHIIRGIPREAVQKDVAIAGSGFRASAAADESDVCPWNIYNYGVKDNEAGQAYYDSIAKLYASWGVDFIKADCISDHPFKSSEIRMLHDAIRKSGRAMVLSLSPGPTAIENADYVARYAEMWRISDDYWDHWGAWKGHEWSQSLYDQFANAAKWAAKVNPGAWPDADMLPLGYLGPHPGADDARQTRFTRDEQRTMMTLWSIFRSPLIMGGDLLQLDDWTKSLLTNEDVIAVNQRSIENRPAMRKDDVVIWTAEPSDGHGHYIAVFNLADKEQEAFARWVDLGLERGPYSVRDLWEKKELGKAPALKVILQPHASVLWRVE